MTSAERHYTMLFRSQNPNRLMLDCFMSAKRHIHFRASLSASVKEHKNRSKAAKKAWKTRKANAR